MLINLRNALMTGKRLPYDAEVEYLESTGTQWINTGIAAFDWPYLEITCKVNGTYTTNYDRGIIGNSNGGSRWQGIAPKGNSGVLFRGYDNVTTISESVTSDFTTLIFDGPNRTAYAGQTSATLLSGSKAGNGYGIWAYVGRAYPIAMSVASVRIGTSRDNLLFDAIPVRKGTVGYLYDRVSGKLFGNAGTGDFVLGQDVVPVEYIESHRTEYIDTGYYLNNNCRAVFDGYITSTPTWFSGFFGSRVNVNSLNIAVSSNNDGGMGRCDADFSNGSYDTYRATIPSFSAPADFYADISASRRYIRVGSAEASNDTPNTDTFTSADTCKLFWADNVGAGNRCNKSRCRHFSIWDNGVPVRKMLPVRVGSGSTWEGAMMDTLTRRIYRNAGTGAFTYGNDLKYPIPAE